MPLHGDIIFFVRAITKETDTSKIDAHTGSDNAKTMANIVAIDRREMYGEKFKRMYCCSIIVMDAIKSEPSDSLF